MPKRSSKTRQKDTQELARHVLDTVVPDAEPVKAAEPKPEKAKNPAAVALGRLGGLKGGKARAAKLTAEQRKMIASKAAKKRWGERRPS
jgi:hypothetical protein